MPACLAPARLPAWLPPPHCTTPLLLCSPPAHTQAEHGPDSQAVLVALPGVDLEAVQREVARQCDLLPRADTTRRALSHSSIVQVRSKEEAAELSNRCAGTALGAAGWVGCWLPAAGCRLARCSC